MELDLFLLLATLAISLLISCLMMTTSSRRRSGAGQIPPPGPRPLPLVGNLLDLRGGNLHHTLARLARVHGPVMRLRLGLTAAVVVSSRDAAGEAFARHDRRLAGHAVPDASRALGVCGRSMVWLPSSDPRWKALRGVVAAHVFSPLGLAAARGARERAVRDGMVGYLRGRAGREVDVGRAVYGGVLNLVSSAFCSVDVVDMAADDEECALDLQELVEDLIGLIARPNVSDFFPFLRPLDLQGRRRWAAGQIERFLRVLDGIVEPRVAEFISASSSSKTRHDDILGAVLELMSAGKISRDDVTAILFDIFTAGSSTTANTVTWAMAELLRNPGAMATARAEIDRALAGKEEAVGEADAASLPYLQAVVKEAMRLHPVAPVLLPHQAVEDGVEICGYVVPKGCTVIFNSWAIMRDPAAWERPDEFVPERFMEGGGAASDEMLDFRGKDCRFIPFGSGRRLCPGLPMAERVVPFVLMSLLHAFEWRLPDGMTSEQLDVSEKFTTANVLAVPLKAVPCPRW